MKRRASVLRAAYRRALDRLRDARAEIADLQADLDDAIDALTPTSLCGCRFCQQGRVEDAVRDMTPLPPMVAMGLGHTIKWGRA